MTHKTSDTIFIRNLTFDAIIGVLPEERTTPQPICLNLEVGVSTSTAAHSKSLADTLDYAALADQVKAYTLNEKCLLVETLAEGLAELTLSQPQAEAVTIEISKPRALVEADAVGVRIYRARKS